jgi:hypothetical protein
MLMSFEEEQTALQNICLRYEYFHICPPASRSDHIPLESETFLLVILYEVLHWSH